MNLGPPFTGSSTDSFRKSFTRIAQVGKPQGLKGGFYFNQSSVRQPLPELASLLKKLPLYLGPSSDRLQSYICESVFLSGQRYVLRLKGLSSREAIEPYESESLWVESSQLKAITGLAYLWEELDGLQVIDSLGDVFGEITSIDNYGASDVVTIKISPVKISSGMGESESLDVQWPFVETYFNLKSLDFEKRQISACFEKDFFIQ